jgi:hypothetical protein
LIGIHSLTKQLIKYGYDKFGQLSSANKYKNSTPQPDYSFAYQYDAIGNRTEEQRNGFNILLNYNDLNQPTNRQWSGTLVLSGKTDERPLFRPYK